jgi:predicted small secreted protein
MKNIITILSCAALAVTSLAVLTGCNTTAGLGKDIEATGSAITDGAEKVHSDM